MAAATKIPASSLTIASQAEALAGSNNTKMMTPLRVTEALAASVVSFPPGIMCPYGGSSAPTGWLLCYGQSLLRADYAALFAIIGTTFGAVDGTHFTMPDMRGRLPIGKDNMGGSAANVAQATTNITCTNGSAAASVASATGLCVGMTVVSTNTTAGTTITVISGTNITLSAVATASTTVSGRFSMIADAQTLGSTGGTLVQTLTTPMMPAHTHTYEISQLSGSGSNSDPGTDATQVTTSSSTGGGQPHPNLPPSIVTNYIMKT